MKFLLILFLFLGGCVSTPKDDSCVQDYLALRDDFLKLKEDNRLLKKDLSKAESLYRRFYNMYEELSSNMK